MIQRAPLPAMALILLGSLLAGPAVLAQASASSAAPVPQRSGEGQGLVPTIPVILDGVEFPAGALPPSKTGRTFVLTAEDQANGKVHAFSSPEVAEEFVRRHVFAPGPDGSPASLASCAHPYDFSEFNKNRGGGGSDRLFMDMIPGTPDPDIYWNLDFGGWNNTISWVAAACNLYTTSIYSCRYFEYPNSSFSCDDPDRLQIQPGVIITDLLPYGFNNRTSSIKFGA